MIYALNTSFTKLKVDGCIHTWINQSFRQNSNKHTYLSRTVLKCQMLLTKCKSRKCKEHMRSTIKYHFYFSKKIMIKTNIFCDVKFTIY